MYINAKPFNRSSVLVDLNHNFEIFKIENDLPEIAIGINRVNKILQENVLSDILFYHSY